MGDVCAWCKKTFDPAEQVFLMYAPGAGMFTLHDRCKAPFDKESELLNKEVHAAQDDHK